MVNDADMTPGYQVNYDMREYIEDLSLRNKYFQDLLIQK
jgi:hypothetical protein